MKEDKAKIRNRIVMSSTNVDKHGMVMAKEALESALKFINGDKKPRLGLEHNKTFPPLGRINNGEVVKGKDGAYYLLADQEYFDTKESLKLPNGLELIRESFSGSNYPFIECEFEAKEKIEIQSDYVNFNSFKEREEFMNNLRSETDIDFESSEFIRKSEIPDPEIVIHLTEILGITLGIGLRKIPEKLAEAVGEDLVKFYRLLTKTINRSVSELIPKNRPIHFVVEIPIEETLAELIVTTRNADVALKAFDKKFIKKLKGDIEVSIKEFNAAKIQFVLNEEKNWELNYLLTKEGKVIGTKKSLKKRDDFFQKMVDKNIEKKKNNV